MENMDKTNFSLDDGDDEIVEEEVVDRDEEYDDDGYDDEEYADDEYDDEEYDEGDDGYNDDYYDDRLNKVLDEIAELKRGMAPANQQQQQQQQPPPPIPQYIYPSAPSAGSEVVMYNEISRLRDELARNQSNLEMQKELTRLKDDMARDQRLTESQYSSEIKRLQDKIEDLLKNASSPQGELPAAHVADQPRIEGGSSKLDFERLLSINESILRAAKESDARIQSDIVQLRKSMESLPSAEELNRAVSAVKKAAQGASGGDLNSEAIARLSNDIASLRSLISDKGVMPVAAAPVIKTSGGGKGETEISSSEMLRQLYDIKTVLGSSSAAAVRRNQTLLELANDLKKVVFDIGSRSVTFKDKLTAVYAYSKKLSECTEPDIVEFLEACNKLISELASQQITRSVFADIVSYSSEENGMAPVSSATRDNAERYFNITDKIAAASTDELSDYLPDLLAEKNLLQSNAHAKENESLFMNITNAMMENDYDAAAVSDMVAELSALTIGDIVDLPSIPMPKVYKPSRSVNDDTIYAKLADIKSTILDNARAKVVVPDDATDDQKASAAFAQEVLDSIDHVNAGITALQSDKTISDALEELRNDYLDVSNKIVDISERLAEQSGANEGDFTAEQKQQTLDDLAYIHSKLDDYELFINQIGELRSDVLNISGSIDLSEQFDKLYEDLSNVVIETETNLTARIGEVVPQVTQSLDAAVEQLRQDLTLISDTAATNYDATTADRQKLIEDVEFLRAQVESQLEQKAQEDELASQGVLTPEQEERNKIYAYLDEIASRVAVLNTVADDAVIIKESVNTVISDIGSLVDAVTMLNMTDDINAIKENATTLIEAMQPLTEQIGAVNEAVNNMSETSQIILEAVSPMTDDLTATRESSAQALEAIAPVSERIDAMTESVNGIADTVASTANTAAATLDAVTPIVDNILTINDNIANMTADFAGVSENASHAAADISETLGIVRPIADDTIAARDAALSAHSAAAAALDALAPINDQLNSIIERLDTAESMSEETVEEDNGGDAVLDDLEEIKDGINAVLDTLPLLPQADDLITARDNTFSILDTLTLMPQADDVVTIRDNAAAILDAVSALTESIHSVAAQSEEIAAIRTDTSYLVSAIPEGFAEDIALVRDNTATVLDTLASLAASQEDIAAVRQAVGETLSEDIGYIRQKLDEEPQADDSELSDSLANILQDLGTVLDKLETYEQSNADFRKEVESGLADVKEEVHMKELDANLTASGINEEVRDTLISEISEIRERLNTIDSTTQMLNDVNASALDAINSQLADIQAAVGGETVPAENSDAVLATLDDINEKLTALCENQGASPEVSGEIEGSIEQIKEMLAENPDRLAAIEEEIAKLSERLDVGKVTVESDSGTVAQSSEDLQSVLDELTLIKEKVEVNSEYDVVAEILSLRDDIKAARIVDQNDVSGELESIKNELAYISSGSILDEVRALRDDIAALNISSGGDVETASAPTEDELNLVLNEIVSLRDEVFAFKDEVLNATAQPQQETTAVAEEKASNDDINTLLDELTALRADQTVLNENVDDLKDIISRRTSLPVEGEGVKAAGNELNVVLDEIINLKSDIDKIDERIPTDRLDTITAQVDEIRGMIEQLQAVTTEQPDTVDTLELAEIKDSIDSLAAGSLAVDLTPLAEQMEKIGSAIDEIRLNQALVTPGAVESGSGAIAEQFESLHAEIQDIKSVIESGSPTDYENDIAQLRAEINMLRAENEQLKSEGLSALSADLSELKTAVRDLALAAPQTTAEGEASYAALIDEIKSLKAEVATAKPATIGEDLLAAIRDALAANADERKPLSLELGEIRDEIAQLRSLNTVGGATDDSELAELRDELAELKQAMGGDSLYGLSEDVMAIKNNVKSLKEEPDLGVMNEILALRDEFQSLREQIEDVKRIAGQTDKQSDDVILNEVQSLRDQLFAISMANVNDSASGETNYESYNNIILDEIASLRDQVESAGSSDELRTISDELNRLKSTLDEREKTYDMLAERVAKIDSDATNNRILEELASLRTELANQRDADLTTLNFMSEMAHLLERQNSYISQNTGSKITDEIESLKAELASSDAVAEEVAKLRDVMAASGNASDNESILNELAELREELSNEKPSRENELILEAIARLKDEMTALAESGAVKTDEKPETDKDLSGSLSDLRSQLNEIAGIVEPKKPATKKPTTAKSTTKGRPAAKKPTAKKTTSTAKPKAVAVDKNDIEARVNEELQNFIASGDMGLDPNMDATSDELEVADKLAKQVANKLIMEQLVEQLGDGGVSEERVDEIVKDILPQEFTTVAINEQSDKVRQLANQLVLDKLRERLGGKKSDGDDSEE